MSRPDSTAKNMPKIAEVKLSSCGLEVADLRKNYGCRIARLRLRNCDCGSAAFKFRNYDCGLKKMLRLPTSEFMTALSAFGYFLGTGKLLTIL
jgi:hypothetical protein